ncbi:permease [Clostridium acetobutylicum]|nr:permease [Clostridium acetobutylicum]
MYRLITNELQKIFKRRKVLVVSIVFIAIILFFSLVQYKESHKTPVETIVQNEKYISVYKEEMAYLDADTQKRVKENIAQYKNEIQEAYRAEDLDKLNWKDRIKYQISDDEKKKKLPDIVSDDTKIEQVNAQILSKKYALKNSVPDAADDYNEKALDVFIKMVSYVSLIILPVIICVIVLDVVSGECSPPTMKMLLTKPFSRGKILFSKFMAASIASIIAIVFSELISLIILGIVIGFGSINAPVSLGTKYQFNADKVLAGNWHDVKAIIGSTYVEPQWKVMLEMFGLEILFILAFTSICILISVLVNSNTVSMTSGIIIAVIMSFIVLKIMAGDGSSAGDVPFRKIAPYLINTYSSPGFLLSGDMTSQIRNPDISVGLGVLVNVTTGAVCYIIAHIRFTRKDMLV